ncbi:MAG TPA: fibronectin type III domain-containing protein [Gammaproteobacteria bacterium]|nr:fibronectin type III domain-containing protein [Gammaproteobacteria bacterium]
MERCLKVIRKIRILLIVMPLLLTGCGGGGGGETVAGSDVGTGTTTGGGSTSGNTTVAAQQVGAARLSWQPPSQRVDGESLSLSEIGSYRIYYGTRSGRYDYRIEISDPSTTSYVITDLPVDTYYFVLTTVDVDGRESGYSTEAVKRVTSS